MKKICKFLTFLLVLAMLLSTVAMAEDTYTITAGEFTHEDSIKFLLGEERYQIESEREKLKKSIIDSSSIVYL